MINNNFVNFISTICNVIMSLHHSICSSLYLVPVIIIAKWHYGDIYSMFTRPLHAILVHTYSISQDICTRFLLCFAVFIHWLIFPYPSDLLHWHCGNLTIAPMPAKQPWWIWINTSCEFIMNDCITTTKQSTTKPCAYFLGYTVYVHVSHGHYV